MNRVFIIPISILCFSLASFGGFLGYLQSNRTLCPEVSAMATNSFSEMTEVLKQYDAGLITRIELINALQMDSFQQAALNQVLALPYQVQQKINIGDFDEAINTAREKARAYDREYALSSN